MKKELNLNDMEMVVGGVERVVDTGIAGLNAAIRKGPSTSTNQIASLPNGTVVDTVDDELVYDQVAGRNFVQIIFIDKNGNRQFGWIAASIVGLKR